MTITKTVRVSDRKLVIKNRIVLSGVPDNVISSSAVSSGPVDGIFLGTQFSEPSCRHVVSLGTLRLVVDPLLSITEKAMLLSALFG
ncbi:hypothetical protein BHE74_00006240 [Ensete ventricosum]|nr:hypothetical protein GW17_00006478 [Ensete ventricosum]RWW85114.1 hypothetical protein BHE74_00006240 [Ensete ventricosum]RZR88376.1 hypothetical protein BHM03_00015980 [Ensete ventricosum]